MGLLQFLIDHDFILSQFGLAFAVGFGHNDFALVVGTFFKSFVVVLLEGVNYLIFSLYH